MDKDKLGIDLQLFAEEEIEGEEVEGEEEQEELEEEKTYTQAELDKLLQQEGDRRVSSARDKIIKEYEEKIEREKKEARRLAELSAEERKIEEANQTKKELEETKAQLNRMRLEQDTTDLLEEEGISIGYRELVIGNDADETNERIKLLKSLLEQDKEAITNEFLKGDTPRRSAGTPKGDNPWAEDTFNLTKQGQIIREDPERAKQLQAAAKK